MGIDVDETVSPDLVYDLKTTRTIREILPILVLLFTPITIVYDTHFLSNFSTFFVFARVDIITDVGVTYFALSFPYLAVFLVMSIPALIASIFSSWMLHRLSYRKITARGVFRAMIGVTVVWVIYLSIFFFGALFTGYIVVGPFPVPFGPLAAVLSRNYIMRLTEQIDELEKP
jgi:hypothetical protein